MSSIFAISGRNIVYAEKLIKSNGLPFTPGEDSMWMPCGRFFPVSHAGMALIEYLLDPRDLCIESSHNNFVLGILVTPKGLVYEYGLMGQRVIRRLIPMGKGLKYCRAADAQLEESMTAAMECCDELVDAMNLVAKSRKLLLSAYKYTTLTNVYAELEERKITKQPPVRMQY
jgi:hypothetical protein